jgi:hypothetical protein
LNYDSRQQQKHEHLYRWHRTIEQYSKCTLTCSDDKLPAISGFARAVAAALSLHYAAGLWQESLVDDLLWKVEKPNAARLQRHPTYRAPSWSWAAIDAEISYSPYSVMGPKRSELDHIEVKLHPRGIDPFGQLASGTVTVTGKLKEMHYDWYLFNNFINLRDKEGYHCGQVFPDEAQKPEGLVYGLLVNGEETPDPKAWKGLPFTFELHWYILLLQSTGNQNEFRRIGIATLERSGRQVDFWEVPKARIVII